MPDIHPSCLVIDPHPVVRRGLVAALQDWFHHIEIAASPNFTDARRFLAHRRPDLIISEYSIDGESIPGLIEHLDGTRPAPRCLVFTAADETRCGVPAIRGGASGFVSKSAPLSDLAAAVRSVLAGRPWISESLAHALASPNNGAPRASRHLTRREGEIFSLLGQGLTVSRIAAELGLSVKTIEAHRHRIKAKFGLQTAAQVIIAASRWIDDPASGI